MYRLVREEDDDLAFPDEIDAVHGDNGSVSARVLSSFDGTQPLTAGGEISPS